MKNLILILALTITLNTFGQKEDIKYASFNILSSGIIGGIGSGIHKKQGETFGKAFINGFWRGSIAGSLNVASKEILSIQAKKENLDWKLCWGSKIVNSFSNTILYNATMNEAKLYENYSINIGFVRLSTKYKIQIDPISFGCTIYCLIDSKIDIKNSLITGCPSFKKQFPIIYIYDKKTSKYIESPRGRMLAQNIIIQPNSKTNVFIHELIHTYQRLQYSNINNSFKIYNKYENYKFIHNDISSYDILYFLQNKTIKYDNNLFESEAIFYGKNN
jgi:hypothetical protein